MPRMKIVGPDGQPIEFDWYGEAPPTPEEEQQIVAARNANYGGRTINRLLANGKGALESALSLIPGGGAAVKLFNGETPSWGDAIPGKMLGEQIGGNVVDRAKQIPQQKTWTESIGRAAALPFEAAGMPVTGVGEAIASGDYGSAAGDIITMALARRAGQSVGNRIPRISPPVAPTPAPEMGMRFHSIEPPVPEPRPMPIMRLSPNGPLSAPLELPSGNPGIPSSVLPDMSGPIEPSLPQHYLDVIEGKMLRIPPERGLPPSSGEAWQAGPPPESPYANGAIRLGPGDQTLPMNPRYADLLKRVQEKNILSALQRAAAKQR